jgi:transcriptional regulator with XRE-family HTH domain
MWACAFDVTRANLHFIQNRFHIRKEPWRFFPSVKITMISDTLSSGLQQYGIGTKLRMLRLRKKLGLVELGRHTGLSAAMLSKIERGLLFPTLPTLLRIALVFGVGLEFFFSQDTSRPRVAVIRKRDRLLLPDRPGAKTPAYLFESLDFPITERKIDAFYAEFPNDAVASDLHRHDGAELVYVLRGKLSVVVDEEETLLMPGDAMYFDSGAAHGYRRHGRSVCAVIVVVAPK